MKRIPVRDVPPGDVFLYQAGPAQTLRAWIRCTTTAEQEKKEIMAESYYSYKEWSDPGQYLYLHPSTYVLV